MTTPELLSVPSPFLLEFSRLRVLEPLDTPIDLLYERLLDGTYDKPYIVEDGQLRYLHLGVTFVQSVMRIDDPDALDLRYTQKMMSFLLFRRRINRIVMLGLGGGSLAKFCYRNLPDADITIVEIDPNVIALRRHFAIPDDDARFRIVAGDAADYVAEECNSVEVLLVDAFDARGLAMSMASEEFLENAYAALDDEGILVMNFAGKNSRYKDLIGRIRVIFDFQTILMAVKEDDNQILLAFKQRLFEPDWSRLRHFAKELRAHYRLDFPAFVQIMARAAGTGHG